LLISLAIVIEVIEHKTHVRIHVFSEMVLHSFLFIYCYFKALLLLVEDLTSLSRDCAIPLLIQGLYLIKSSWLWKILRALRLMNELGFLVLEGALR
jgi:hypothetical protein